MLCQISGPQLKQGVWHVSTRFDVNPVVSRLPLESRYLRPVVTDPGSLLLVTLHIQYHQPDTSVHVLDCELHLK